MSDLERLEFISEGDHYFEQLQATSCPICGSSLEAHSKNRECLNINGERVNLMQACREEAAKINTHVHDLEEKRGRNSQLKSGGYSQLLNLVSVEFKRSCGQNS
jgi:hypothetical protein